MVVAVPQAEFSAGGDGLGGELLRQASPQLFVVLGMKIEGCGREHRIYIAGELGARRREGGPLLGAELGGGPGVALGGGEERSGAIQALEEVAQGTVALGLGDPVQQLRLALQVVIAVGRSLLTGPGNLQPIGLRAEFNEKFRLHAGSVGRAQEECQCFVFERVFPRCGWQPPEKKSGWGGPGANLDWEVGVFCPEDIWPPAPCIAPRLRRGLRCTAWIETGYHLHNFCARPPRSICAPLFPPTPSPGPGNPAQKPGPDPGPGRQRRWRRRR